MLSRVESRKKIVDNPGRRKLFVNQIEDLNKALNSERARSNSLISAGKQSKSVGKSRFPEPKLKVKDDNKDSLDKDGNKKSIWSWKGLKALTHVRNRKFNCCFSLQVHSIESLPSSFDTRRLVVHWKRRDGELVTRPVRVSRGLAEFEEQLTHSCSVYGSRSGPHHSAKYEAKHFLLYASIHDSPEIDLGKHRVDLTRFLPITLEELEEEKSSGKWSTNFRLTGEARGATMNVSFGYTVIGNSSDESAGSSDVPGARQNSSAKLKQPGQSGQLNELGTINQAGSLPVDQSMEVIKDLHEVLPETMPELADCVSVLYEKLNEDKLNDPTDCKPELDVSFEPLETPKADLCFSSGTIKEITKSENEDGDISTIIQPVELSKPEDETLKAAVDVEEIIATEAVGEVIAVEQEDQLQYLDENPVGFKDELSADEGDAKRGNVWTKESLLNELKSALNSVSDLVKEELDSDEDENDLLEEDNSLDIEANDTEDNRGKFLSSDDDPESVANEFLDMLGIEHSPFGLSSESEPESPRERLLRQFEKDTLANGCSLFDFDIDEAEGGLLNDASTESWWNTSSENLYHSMETPAIETEETRNTPRAKKLADMETEELMREWGLNEEAFHSSPPENSGGFGSPIDVFPEDLYQLPPLGEGLGPFIQTKNGGFVRSMNPALFINSKNSGNLIMQVSSPVVVPAEMGSGVMDIMQHLASIGIEKLSMQANRLMPLEDITGKTMQQIAWEATPSLETSERQYLPEQEPEFAQSKSTEAKSGKRKSSGYRSTMAESRTIPNDVESEYVSLEDLAPLAMDKIEALSIEGLRIQSGMANQNAPSNINPQSIGEFSVLEGKRVNLGGSLGLDGTGSLQLLDIKDNAGGDLDGLMGLSLTLDEWMRLDSGEIDDEDQISERTSKILAAHHATSTDLFRARTKGEKKRGRSRKCGLLANNFTVALMVQLRDPLRNYELVGAPMLALVQVERVLVPPKPKIYSTVSVIRISQEDEDEEESKPALKEEIEEIDRDGKQQEPEEQIPQFKITEVHVAGLKTEPSKKKLWGSTAQQQSGSRWLLANGMGKKNKHPLMKSKTGSKSSLPTPPPATATAQPDDTLWSISSRVHGTGARWRDRALLNQHIRNPNVILPNESTRLR